MNEALFAACVWVYLWTELSAILTDCAIGLVSHDTIIILCYYIFMCACDTNNSSRNAKNDKVLGKEKPPFVFLLLLLLGEMGHAGKAKMQEKGAENE